MRRVLASTLMLSCSIVVGLSRAAFAQAASIPLSLSITASPSETSIGGAVSVVVRLKNYKGDTVAASEPVAATLHSELSGDAALSFKPGQSSANAEVRFQRGGLATLVAAAPGMTSGSAMVVVKAADEAAAGAVESPGRAVSPPPRAGGRPGAPAPPGERAPVPRPAPAAGGATTSRAAGETNVMLAVDVLPQHVHPANAAWRALVLVTAINDRRQPVPVQADTVVYLAIDIGEVTPQVSQIDAGKAHTTGMIQLTSDRAGSGTLWVWTDTGSLTAAAIEYHDAVPTQLLVRGLPSRVVNDGKTAVNVTVFLQDETAATASADQDIAVKLISSVGTPAPSDFSIAKGKFFGEAVLTSPISGKAEITATAPRLKPGSAQVEFVFPLLLVMLAGTGGLIGSVVRSGGQLFTGAWWHHLLGSVAMGIVLGLLFYALALFGIIASIPKLAIPLAQLPTTNDLGAVVLGFLGGYYGRTWLPVPGDA